LDGRVKISVVSERGKEAVVALHGKGSASSSTTGIQIYNSLLNVVLQDNPRLRNRETA
jgi:hypothetical protein